jgi:hypothetical protein
LLEASSANLKASSANLEASSANLEACNANLEVSNGALERSNGPLEASNSNLEASNSNLEASNSSLERSNGSLGASKGELRRSKTAPDFRSGGAYRPAFGFFGRGPSPRRRRSASAAMWTNECHWPRESTSRSIRTASSRFPSTRYQTPTP